MSCWLVPDYMFDRFDDVSVPFLKSKGIVALIIDIDNTLVPYEQPEPDERIRSWFLRITSAGIRVSLISNNEHVRVELFNRTLGLPAYPKAGKPCGKYFRLAMQAMKSTPRNTAVLGDQLLTDALAGKRLGMRAIIVPPIRDKKNLLFRTKRMIEKPFIAYYKRNEKNNHNK